MIRVRVGVGRSIRSVVGRRCKGCKSEDATIDGIIRRGGSKTPRNDRYEQFLYSLDNKSMFCKMISFYPLTFNSCYE